MVSLFIKYDHFHFKTRKYKRKLLKDMSRYLLKLQLPQFRNFQILKFTDIAPSLMNLFNNRTAKCIIVLLMNNLMNNRTAKCSLAVRSSRTKTIEMMDSRG